MKCSNKFDRDGYKFSDSIFTLNSGPDIHCYSCHDIQKILFENAKLLDGYFPTIQEKQAMSKFYENSCSTKEYEREKSRYIHIQSNGYKISIKPEHLSTYENLLINLLYTNDYKEKVIISEKLNELAPYRNTDFPLRNFKTFSLGTEPDYKKPEYTLLQKIKDIKTKLKDE
jgi:hypothetical protein